MPMFEEPKSNAEGVRIVTAGIDTIHLSASRRHDIPAELLDAADRATAAHAEEPFEWADEQTGEVFTLLVQPGGGRRGSYVLMRGRDFDFKVCGRETKSVSRIEVRAEAQWVTRARACGIAQRIAAACAQLLGRREGLAFWKVARVDLCADVHMNFVTEDTKRWRQLAVFDAERVGLAEQGDRVFGGADETWRQWGRFTGWVFGRGDPLMGRVYNKSLQAETKSPWMFELWSRCRNYRPERTVWRIEFELKRGVLDAFRVNTLEELESSKLAIWRYLTLSWLTFRSEQDEKVNAASWSWISRGAFDPLFLSQVPEARREPKDLLDLKQSLAQGAGLLTNAFVAAVRMGRLDPAALEKLKAMPDLFPEELRPVVEAALEGGELKSHDLKKGIARASKKRLVTEKKP